MSKGYSKIILAGLLLVALFVLEIKQKAAFGWSFDLILAAILILPLFLDLMEFLFFGSLVLFLLKFAYPWSGFEIVLLILFPFLAFFFQKIFPWQSWLEPFILVFFGISAFYGLTNPSAFFGNIGFSLLNISVSMILGWAIYCLMTVFAERRN